MRKSEIFESFVKIAQESGLVSNAEGNSEDSKKKLEKNPRADSLDISAIEALYGVKIDTPKNMEYKKNIMEDAHPESAIVSPAYDKLNGLVENNIERQNILLHIINKTPDGLQTQHKYAQKELLLSLIRVANDLDNREENDLRTLADSCLHKLAEQKTINKFAFPWLAAGVAAAFGAFYAQQHLPLANEGFEINHKKLIGELDDLITANSNWGVGSSYKKEFISEMEQFKNELEEFHTEYERIYPAITEITKPKTKEELKNFIQSNGREAINGYKKLYDLLSNLSPKFKIIFDNFKSEDYKSQQIEDKGWATSLVDKVQFLHGGSGLVSDDFDDVARAIVPYTKSIAYIISILKKAKSKEKDAETQLKEAESFTSSTFGPSPDS